MFKQFGGKIKAEHIAKYKKSPQWNGKIFENLETTTMDIGLKNMPKLIKYSFTGRATRGPQANIPIPSFNQDSFYQSEPTFVWYGHAVLLLRIGGKNLLIDPMFGPDASPIGPIRTPRFSKDSLSVIDQLPEIDAVLMTHDHYDHLDLASFQKYHPKVDRYFVALGVERHLEKWGVPASHIQSFDWWDTFSFEGLTLTFTPSRHFAGRGAFDRAKSFWGGWVIQSNSHQVYWSGDGGYGGHFKEVGERFEKFDIGFMECGQYNPMWHQIHMYPEEAVQAAQDSNVKKIVPVHWGGFTLALHHWTDPIERFVNAAKSNNFDFNTPEIGAVFGISDSLKEEWWRRY